MTDQEARFQSLLQANLSGASETPPSPLCVLSLRPWLTLRLCLVFPLILWLETPHFALCVSTASVAKTLPFLALRRRRQRR